MNPMMSHGMMGGHIYQPAP
jgi:hypothetical protein